MQQARQEQDGGMMKGTCAEILQGIWTIEPPGLPDELHTREKKRRVKDVGISNLKSLSMEVGKRVEQVVKEGRDLLDNLGQFRFDLLVRHPSGNVDCADGCRNFRRESGLEIKIWELSL